jgi:hypothetical protein
MIDWIIPIRSGTTSYMSASIALCTYQNKQTQSYQLVLRFSEEAQHDLRLIVGDRLLVGFDELTEQICFKRTTQGGHKLSGKTKSGNVLTLSVTVKNRTVIPPTRYAKQSVVIESTHVSINAPEFFN